MRRFTVNTRHHLQLSSPHSWNLNMFSKSLSVKSHFLSLESCRHRGRAVMSTKITCSRQQVQGDTRRHFVLVHGACHGAWSWYKVSAILKSAGHHVAALDMAASGIHPKQVNELHSFSDYYEPLMEFMASLPPEERVVLVGHSMNGICMSIAMEKFPEKISVGVFTAATMPGPDLSFKDIAKKFSEKPVSMMDNQYVFGNGNNNPPTASLLGPQYMAAKHYHLSPPEDLVLATMLVRPFPLYNEEIVLTRERYGSIPRVYIVCDEGNDEFQRWLIEKNPVDEVKVIPGSDHMPMISKPQELCTCLQDIADKY